MRWALYHNVYTIRVLHLHFLRIVRTRYDAGTNRKDVSERFLARDVRWIVRTDNLNLTVDQWAKSVGELLVAAGLSRAALSKCIGNPSKSQEYNAQRSHGQFPSESSVVRRARMAAVTTDSVGEVPAPKRFDGSEIALAVTSNMPDLALIGYRGINVM